MVKQKNGSTHLDTGKRRRQARTTLQKELLTQDGLDEGEEGVGGLLHLLTNQLLNAVEQGFWMCEEKEKIGRRCFFLLKGSFDIFPGIMEICGENDFCPVAPQGRGVIVKMKLGKPYRQDSSKQYLQELENRG